MNQEIHDRIITRLLESGDVDEPWSGIIVAALEGSDRLEAYLEGRGTVGKPAAPERASTRKAVESPGAYVSSITVQGFRGVGPEVTLDLRPGPGLTLIVGRNGSGKSSFAEALEFLLTGSNYRWDKRPKVWVQGWRNLHHKEHAALRAEMLVEGTGSLTVSREWKPDEDVGTAKPTVKGKTGGAQPFSTIGWNEALITFRPFLSYNELGSLLDEGPSKLYDALSSVLGLDELTEVQDTLAVARKTRQDLVKRAKEAAEAIRSRIAAMADGGSDRRLARASLLLQGSSWDVIALRDLIHGERDDAVSDVDVLRRLAAIAPPDENAVAKAAERLRATQRAVDDLAGTDAQRASDLAELLEQAVVFHEIHKAADCPVCGAEGVLKRSWVTASKKEIDRLRKEAASCKAAVNALKEAVREGQRLASSPPPVLAQAVNLGLPSLPEARKQWIAWSEGRDLTVAPVLAARLERHVLELVEVIRSLIEEARLELKKREDVWQPVAAALTEWLPHAEQALRAQGRIKELKAAEEWWKETSGSLRDERFAPIADRALAVWNQLRLMSNVDLGKITLEGTAQRRRVSLDVKVDGTPAEALGVMSQGELHSLALSLFLPRATLPESPFRFMAIDDPVQSMDPARVEGLARTLADAAQTRQVIVFTHDDRLPEAVRRLGLQATVVGVTRRAKSVVEVRRLSDPVRNLLDDAWAVASTEDLPQKVAQRVVPGFCRTAVEAACMEKIRRRRLGRGETHDQVEELLTNNPKAHPLMALAVADDERKTEDVGPRLKKWGGWAQDVFNVCKAGAHKPYDGDLKDLINNTRRLADRIAELPS